MDSGLAARAAPRNDNQQGSQPLHQTLRATLPCAARVTKAPIMYVIAFPLLLIPFALYNMIAFLLNMPFTDTMFSIPLMADRRLPVTTGDLLLVIAMLLIYVEVLKVTRVSKTVMDHL